MKVGLFGTVIVNKTLDDVYGWRKDIIPLLEQNNIEYYNPVVINRGTKEIEIENQQKELCDMEIYVLTVDLMGYYSIAEAVKSSYEHGSPDNTIFCILNKEYFPYGKLRSLEDVERLLQKRGCYIAKDLNDIVNYIIKNKESE